MLTIQMLCFLMESKVNSEGKDVVTENTKSKQYTWIVGWVFVFFAIYAVLIMWLSWSSESISLNETGVFGDSFGALTALFSGLAFAGMMITVLLQKDELALQRRELELTRVELYGQKEQMKAQNETLRKQNFENTFFELLRLQNEITNSIDIREGGELLEGRDCFERFYSRLANNIHHSRNKGTEDFSAGILNSAYRNFYDGNESDIGHYFRTLYNLVAFVHEGEIENKRLYTNLIRAQLSTFELVLLFHHCITEFGNQHFKPLVERYGLLQNIPMAKIANGDAIRRMYVYGAFE